MLDTTPVIFMLKHCNHMGHEGKSDSCVTRYMRILSPFGSKGGSAIRVALRRFPRISTSKAPSAVSVASPDGT